MLSSQFRMSLDNNYRLFGKHAFRKHELQQEKRGVLNASLWDVMSTGLSRYSSEVVEQNAEAMRDAFYDILGDDEFIDAITRGPNSPNQVKRRFAMAKEMFRGVFDA